jgi:hypothetical protein
MVRAAGLGQGRTRPQRSGAQLRELSGYLTHGPALLIAHLRPVEEAGLVPLEGASRGKQCRVGLQPGQWRDPRVGLRLPRGDERNADAAEGLRQLLLRDPCQPGSAVLKSEFMLDINILSPAKWTLLRDMRLAALRESPQAFLSTHEREIYWGEDQWLAEFDRGD